MKNPLSDLYEQILLSEAEKSQLQNPSNDEIGKIDAKQDLFGTKPKPVEGPEKAKLQQGPSYKETTGSAVHTAKDASKGSFKGSAPAKPTQAGEPKETKDTEVDPSEHEEKEEKEEKPKKQKQEESFTMSAFETLFKKTLNEEFDENPSEEGSTEETLAPGAADNSEAENSEAEEGEEHEDENEEEGDLVSDLKDLQDKLSSILAKLEDVSEENEGEEEIGEESYSEEDFDEEFSDDEEDEENPMKESVDKPKPLATAKGKHLMNKKNKVGKLSSKGGKAHSGSVKTQPNPQALGDKKGKLQKGSHVKSNISKGEFFK